MKWMCALVIVMAAAALGQAAESGAMRASKPAVKTEIVATIEGQLAAFRGGEIERAYAYATSRFQIRMPIRQFAQSVRLGYPEIWTNERAEFGLARDDGRRATLTARIFAKDGRSAAYDYVLVREDDFWRIAGVLRHEAKDGSRM